MVSSSHTAVLVSLAALMGLTPAEAVALPTVVEVCARKSGMIEADFISNAAENAPLRDYMVGICRIGAEALA